MQQLHYGMAVEVEAVSRSTTDGTDLTPHAVRALRLSQLRPIAARLQAWRISIPGKSTYTKWATQCQVAPLLTAVAPLEAGPSWFDRLHRREPGLLKVVLEP